MQSRFTIRRRTLLAAVSFAIVALAACGGGDPAPIPAATVQPIGPQTEEEAIQGVRDFLAASNFEGGFNCLETLEAGEATWTATRPDETQWAVTLRADPPALIFSVHTWAIFTLDGRVKSNRIPC
jgi:hypothetical protein